MAFFSRYKSAPQLEDASDSMKITLDASAHTDEEESTEGEEKSSSKMGGDDAANLKECGCSSIDNKYSSLSLEAPDISQIMESGFSSKAARRKKRVAVMTRRMPPIVTFSQSYSGDLDRLGLQSSTSVESTASDSKILYQTSADSVLFTLGNCSSDCADEPPVGSTSTYPSPGDVTQSPKTPSRLHRLRQAFRSPQIGRKKLSKDRSFEDKLPRLKKSKSEDGTFVKAKKANSEERSKFLTPEGSESFESIPEISDCVIAIGYAALAVDQEFEVSHVYSHIHT